MMNKHKKFLSIKVFSVIIILVMMSINSFSRVVLNYSDIAYNDITESSIRLDTYIVESAGYFLKGYADILLFLNKIERAELDGTDYNEWLEILNQAIGNMDQAKTAYGKLTGIANNSPYNPAIIDTLLTFDYERFQLENGLNRDIFAKVKKYLEKGDVRGIYARLLTYTTGIQDKLIELKATVESGNFPIVSKLWQLNQYCLEALLFGQHTAEIFASIKKLK